MNTDLWIYNTETDYSPFYGYMCIIVTNEDDDNYTERKGELMFISEPFYMSDGNYELTVGIHRDYIIESIVSSLISKILIDRTDSTAENFKIVYDLLVRKTGSDPISHITEFLFPDYVYL
jgi:hypothetical protein